MPTPENSRTAAFKELVLQHLQYSPNNDQHGLIDAVARFVLDGTGRSMLLLNGYAGTGKTSLTGAVVKALALSGIKAVLLAPTGRAAHIFGEYAGHPAYTIHRKIYRQRGYGIESFGLNENKHTNTVFIVDEASMIANGTAEGAIFGSGRLLDDLVSFVYQGEGCRLMLMGDAAQLPPVGQEISPALDSRTMQCYGLDVKQVFLREIARQASESGILCNATLLRRSLEAPVLTEPHLTLDGFDDIKAVSSEFLLEDIGDCYDRDGMDSTIIVTRSNKRATLFNLGIRGRILYREDELTGGDMLLIAKNNYYWTEQEKELDFIANGDVARVVRVHGEIERRYGLRFANVVMELPEHDNMEVDVKIVLDCLTSDTPALNREQNERMFNEIMAELPGNKREKYQALKKDPYFNALQVKYAYALTCHKAQGGQWDNVFIDMGGIMPEAKTTIDYHRWLYTAMTRARHRVFLINYTT